jgi:nucleoside-diphosphate-sugar epimerase
LSPESIYAVHKIAAENYLRVFRRTANLRSIVVRLTNPYGPHQSHESRSYGILNRFIRAAARGEEITIFGDGSQRRDYIFVDDVIRAFLLLPLSERCHNETFNLGGLESISLGAAAEHIAQLAGNKVKSAPWPDDFALIETGDFRSDCSKIQRLIGFRPETPLGVGLRRTLEFYRNLPAVISETAPLST